MKLTLLEKSKGLLTKIIHQQDGSIQKDSSECWLNKGKATQLDTTLEKFANGLRKVKPNQALVHGISGHKKVNIVSEKQFAGQANTITRSKKHFGFVKGEGSAFFDHDPKPGQKGYSKEALLETLAEVFPAISEMANVWTPSTSSCIYKNGKELVGQEGGMHIYFAVRDATDLPRFAAVLFKRVWIAGHGYIFITKDGKQLERTIFDKAVFSPERLDFVAGAVCKDGLEQRLPDSVYTSGNVLDTSLLKDLTKQEEAEYKRLVNEAKEKTADKAASVRGQYVTNEVKNLVKKGTARTEAKRVVEKRIGGDLVADDILYFDKLREVKVEDVLKNPGRYDRETLRDPLEPDYDPHKAIFYANTKEGKPVVYSQAHGGRKFFLKHYNNEWRKSTLSSTRGATGKEQEEWNLELPDWPVLSEKALPGIVGDFVNLATQNSEADRAAVLATFLVRFGVEAGHGPVMWIGDTPHRARLCSVVVGASSKARKCTSSKPVDKLFKFPVSGQHGRITPARTSPGPFSSGEGIIYAVRDKVMGINKEGEPVVKDLGVEDKRLFVLDEEFAGVIANTKREGNTLSVVIRCAWDSGNFDPLTKTSKTTATDAHVGWVSHITLNELNAKLTETEAFNGFANRILWICAKRAKLVAWPQPMDNSWLAVIQSRISELLANCKDEVVIRPDAEVEKVWGKIYPDLTKDRPGLVGCVVNRAEAQVMRLSMIYCLLDGKTSIGMNHIDAALAFWTYCQRSAEYIFYGRQADKTAQKILEALDAGALNGTEIYRVFNNNISKQRLEITLSELMAAGRVEKEIQKKKKKGRSTIIYKKTETTYEKNELNELNQEASTEKVFNSLNSFNSSSECKKHNGDEWEDI